MSHICSESSDKDHFPSLMLSRLQAVQSNYGKELKFINLKHCILFSSNGVFICILFSLMKMEMDSLAHPVIAPFQQQRRLDRSVPFPRSHQGKLPACLLAAFRIFSGTNYFSRAFPTLASTGLNDKAHSFKQKTSWQRPDCR